MRSIISACVRAFFVALLSIMGFCIGLLLIFGFMSSLNSNSDLEKEITYTPQVAPNAKNVRKILSSSAPVILKLNIQGIIGMSPLDMQSVHSLLVESREGVLKDDRVKAILLHIESPGGTVVDADGIYRALKAYKTQYKVPVFAYVDGLCASGGMYIASAADKIFASDSSIIGSVGVIVPSFLNFYKLLDKIGVDSLTLSEGKGKDAMNPLRPWKPDEDSNFKMLVSYYYDQFVHVVTSNRPQLDKTKLIKEYGAEVFPAPIAKEYGYIDESNSSLSDALTALAKQIGIDDDYYQVVELSKKTWYSNLFSSTSSLFKGEIKHKVELPMELDPKFSSQFLYLYTH
jgi:protease-4